MEVKNLHFFDNSGYELNFEWNENLSSWEGNVYLPKVSLGLYSNTTIYILEEIQETVEYGEFEKHKEETTSRFVFPRRTKNTGDDKLMIQWDVLNEYVDEFFMFTFDETYRPTETSALTFTPNDGPSCETLLLNRFDTYEIPLDGTTLDSEDCDTPIPIHVAFSSPDQYNATTFKRSLIIYYDHKEIARITFYAETVEEDERLKIWNHNLGYNITKDDALLFYDADIKEGKPDYMLLNQKRKELLIEGHNIYPYIGSYKALLNVIKFFGYNNLNIIEFWKNINPDDDGFGKVYISKKYTLSEDGCVHLKNTEIKLPNKNYTKLNKLALSYTINTPTTEVDLYELPYIKESFTYTIEEVLVKLFALCQKLNKEFLPLNTRIIDIMGEGSYFGIQLFKNGFSYSTVEYDRDETQVSIDCYPSSIVHISDDQYFNDYILRKKSEKSNSRVETETILNSIKDVTLADFDNFNEQIITTTDINTLGLSESKKCELYKEYYNRLTYTFRETEDIVDNDIYDSVPPEILDQPVTSPGAENEDYNITIAPMNKLGTGISAKVILTNTTFENMTFDDFQCAFMFVGQSFDSTVGTSDFQYDYEYSVRTNEDGSYAYNTNDLNHGQKQKIKTMIEWKVIFSDDQDDDDLKDAERAEYYNTVKELYEETNDPVLEGLLDWTPRLNEVLEEQNRTMYQPKNEKGDEGMVTKKFSAVKYGTSTEMNSVLFELPYTGYYDVYMTILKYAVDDEGKIINSNVPVNGYEPHVFKKYIKVEPYNVDIRGFYYDARDIVKNSHNSYFDNYYDDESANGYEDLILRKIDEFTKFALEDINRFDTISDYGYDLTVVRNPSKNRDIYHIGDGPYGKGNFKSADYYIQDRVLVLDNIDDDIVKLIPNLNTAKKARYIKNGVDVKPYTWIFLTFDFSKIVHRSRPVWTLINKSTKSKITYTGKYFTCLLRNEGLYSVSLTLYDENNNEYSTTRNLIVVDNQANYKLYTPFNEDYQAYLDEQEYKDEIKLLDELNDNQIIGDNEDEYYFNIDKLISIDKNGEVTEMTNPSSRLTVKDGTYVGWSYDDPLNLTQFQKICVNFSSNQDGISLVIRSKTNDGNNHDCVYTLAKHDTTDSDEYNNLMIDLNIEELINDNPDVDFQNVKYILFTTPNKGGKSEFDIDIVYLAYDNGFVD